MLAGLSITVAESDVPWPQFRNNSRHTGLSPYVGTQENDLQWVFRTGDASITFSSPTIGPEGNIYVTNCSAQWIRPVFYALDDDGTLAWKSKKIGSHFLYSPAVGSGGTVYSGGSKEDKYGIMAISPDNKIKWFKANTRWTPSLGMGGFSSPVLGQNEIIYLTGTKELYALNSDGTVKWTSPISYYILSIQANDTLVEKLNENKIPVKLKNSMEKENYPIENGKPPMRDHSPVFKVEKDKKWFLAGFSSGKFVVFKRGNELEVYRFISYDSLSPPPAIGPDGNIYVVGYEGLFAFSQDGSRIWSRKMGGYGLTIGSNGTIYVNRGRVLDVITTENEKKWRFSMLDRREWIAGIGLGPQKTVYITTAHQGENLGRVIALNLEGENKWSFKVDGKINTSPAIGSNGKVYFGSMDNKVYCVNPDGTLNWKYSTDGPIKYSSPAIGSTGTVYVGTASGTLYAIGTGKEKYQRVRNKMENFGISLNHPDINYKALDNALSKGRIGASISLSVRENKIVTEMDFQQKEIELGKKEVEMGRISLQVESELEQGRTIFLNLENRLMPNPEETEVLFDGEKIGLADNYNDILDPANEDKPEYYTLGGERGSQVLVSIPEFSAHSITIISQETEKEEDESGINLPLAWIGVGIITIILIVISVQKKYR